MKKLLLAALLISTSVFAAENKSKQKASEVKKEASKMSFSFLSEVNIDMKDINRGQTDALSSYNVIGSSYKLNENDSLAVNLVFQTARPSLNYEGVIDEMGVVAKPGDKIDDKKLTLTNTQKFSWGDSYIKYTRAKSSIFGKEYVGQMRVYLPLSEQSDLVGKYQTRGYMIFSQELNKTFSVDYIINPRVYTYSKDSSGQLSFMGLYLASLNQKINDSVSLSYASYLLQRHYNTGKAQSLSGLSADGSYTTIESKYRDENTISEIYFNLAASFKLTDKVGFDVYMEQPRNFASTSRFVLFDEADTYYGFVLKAKL